MNRYRRRKYGSPPPRRAQPGRRWTVYVLAILVLLAVVYFRVFMLR